MSGPLWSEIADQKKHNRERLNSTSHHQQNVTVKSWSETTLTVGCLLCHCCLLMCCVAVLQLSTRRCVLEEKASDQTPSLSSWKVRQHTCYHGCSWLVKGMTSHVFSSSLFLENVMRSRICVKLERRKTTVKRESDSTCQFTLTL